MALDSSLIERLLTAALDFRSGWIDPEHTTANRLFNGYVEGIPGLVLDLYGTTLLISTTRLLLQAEPDLIPLLKQICLARLPWIDCVFHKTRHSKGTDRRFEHALFGDITTEWIQENGVRYALDLRLNQDSSFYLETRLLRRWLKAKAHGWRAANFFAYTGSLGIAALAGGARNILQVDRSRKFLALARQSAMLSRLDLGRMQLRAMDFFQAAAELKKQAQLFDCVILDPPYFSATEYGRVNLAGQYSRLINKVRPLVADQGVLISINNALYYSGADYLAELELLCRDGYLSIEELIDVPEDVTGCPLDEQAAYPLDPAPFNHPTKIAILRVSSRQK